MKILSTAFPLFGLLFSIWQSDSLVPPNEPVDIYKEALNKYARYLKTVNGFKKSGTLYVQNATYIKTVLPDSLAGYHIEIISEKDIFQKVKYLKSVNLIRIVPAYISNGFVIVNVLDIAAQAKGNNLIYSNGGGISAKFGYNCETNKYYLVN